MGQFFTLSGLLWLLQNMLTLLTTNKFTGVTTAGSTTVTGLSSTAGLAQGQFIVGDTIAAGTTIVSVNPQTNTLVLSQNATGTTASGGTTTLWSYGTAGQSLPLYVHLLTGNVPTNVDTTWAQLTEATFDGYAPQQVQYPFFFSSPDENHGCASTQMMSFVPSDFNVANNITGIAWTYTPVGASGPTLIAVEPFPVPQPIRQTGDMIRVTPTLSFNTDMLGTVASPLL